MGKTIEQAENWKQDTDEIELQFMHAINLSVAFGNEWMEKRKKNLYEELLTDWSYADIVIFEQRGEGRSNFNRDNYVNELMSRNGCVGENVGLGFGV